MAEKNKPETLTEPTMKETAEMMLSDDYKERLLAEYTQATIRYKKLAAMLDSWFEGELDFAPAGSRSIYNLQLRIMGDYIAVLEARLDLEGIRR